MVLARKHHKHPALAGRTIRRRPVIIATIGIAAIGLAIAILISSA